MVFQGVLGVGRTGGVFWVVWLAAALFGSVLTLAMFMKLVHGVFLGRSATAQYTAAARS
jgi:hypothetical protein